MVKKTLNFKTNFLISLKSLLASIIMFIILYFSNFNLLISVILGGFVYISLIYMLGILDKKLITSFFER